MLSDQLIDLIERGYSDGLKEHLSEYTPKEIEAILNTPDSCDNYPIHAAVIKNDLPLIQWLLVNGAIPTVTNFWGSTPVDLAIKLELTEAETLLKVDETNMNTQTEETSLGKGFVDKDGDIIDANDKITKLKESIKRAPQSGSPSFETVHLHEQKQTQEKTNKLLKISLTANIFTMLLALGSMFFSYVSMEHAGWASEAAYFAKNAAEEAKDAAEEAKDVANDLKRWGVDCN